VKCKLSRESANWVKRTEKLKIVLIIKKLKIVLNRIIIK